jgi:hypothetical protein
MKEESVMTKSDRSLYTALDFIEWRAGNSLSLTPKFQRRAVWKPAAKSFFIDTLLRGMPVPPIYIRNVQSRDRDRVIREVVDGQQRISALLGFLDCEYRLAGTLKASWAGKTFDKLSVPERNRITTYAFSAEIFHGLADLDVLEIFSRLNTYSVSLNAQELRNGRFFGLFKQLAYELAYDQLEFWRKHRIFAEQGIARMLEVEFVSEVLVAFLAGMQDKKKSLDDYYDKFDDEFKQRDIVAKRFREVIDELNETMADDLRDTNFRRPPLLYTLLCVIYHRRFGLRKVTLQTPRRVLTSTERLSLKQAVESLSDAVETARSGEIPPTRLAPFVGACLRQTDNIKPRETRFATVYRAAF